MATNSNQIVSFGMNKLHSMKENGVLVNFTLIVNGVKRMSAHKLILASVSSYFCEYFTNKEVSVKSLELNDCDVEAVKVLLDFAYCQLNPNDPRMLSKPLEVIEVASKFQVKGLVEFVNKHLSFDSCFQALKNSNNSAYSSEASRNLLLEIYKSKLTFESFTLAGHSETTQKNQNRDLTAQVENNVQTVNESEVLVKEGSSNQSERILDQRLKNILIERDSDNDVTEKEDSYSNLAFSSSSSSDASLNLFSSKSIIYINSDSESVNEDSKSSLEEKSKKRHLKIRSLDNAKNINYHLKLNLKPVKNQFLCWFQIQIRENINYHLKPAKKVNL